MQRPTLCGITFAIAMLSLFCFSGCGGKGLKPVVGVVKLDGKPLTNATVTFVPEGGEGPAAHAVTSADGRFILDTHGGKGAKPGKYKVMVFKIDESAPKSAGPPPSLVPPTYTKKDKTPIEVTIPHSGDVVLELKSDAK